MNRMEFDATVLFQGSRCQQGTTASLRSRQRGELVDSPAGIQEIQPSDKFESLWCMVKVALVDKLILPLTGRDRLPADSMVRK